MNFTRLLAAGRSVMGIKKAPGPYRMNQEHLLPKFNETPKGADGATESPPAQVEPDKTGSPASAASPTLAVETPEGEADKSTSSGASGSKRRPLFKRLADRVLRVGRRETRPSGKPAGQPVQTELSLDTIKVVRNDLSDSDFALVPQQGTTGAANGKPAGSHQPLGMVWNRLSARLLRQAAQEFNSVQKERGKLLSQAGPAGRGPDGT